MPSLLFNRLFKTIIHAITMNYCDTDYGEQSKHFIPVFHYMAFTKLHF